MSLHLFAQGYKNENFVRYIEKYKDLAIAEMRAHRIPASITLAQGLLESGAGNSELARRSNNHFGIKCGSKWHGKKTSHDDDRRGECFRVYKSVKDSYEDHSIFLLKPRYQSLFRLNPLDYKAWARGLKACGYATNPIYANKLINIIETYELYLFDEDEHGRSVRKPKHSDVKLFVHKIEANNDVLCIRAKHGDTWETLSKEFSISKRKLIKFNDAIEGLHISEGDFVYLEKKQKKASKMFKKTPWHKVKPGESLHSISQLYGVRLDNLCKMNFISGDSGVNVGDLVKIR